MESGHASFLSGDEGGEFTNQETPLSPGIQSFYWGFVTEA